MQTGDCILGSTGTAGTGIMLTTIVLIVILIVTIVFATWMGYGAGYAHAMHDAEHWINEAFSDEPDDAINKNSLRIREAYLDNYVEQE